MGSATGNAHPFSAYIRILGRGPNLSRALTREEAREAMGLILAGTVEPEQLGAFLMLMRYRGETAEELAGFVEAVRAEARLPPADDGLPPDLDWPSYADRHKQMPWFLLAALTLAQNGVRICLHGLKGEAEGFLPTRPVLKALNVPFAGSPAEARQILKEKNIVYLPMECFAPRLQGLLDLRAVLGLRSPANSLARALNPLGAVAQIQGVFHPNYRDLHLGTALLLGQKSAVIFKGGGGEAQRNPDKACAVATLAQGQGSEEIWPALSEQSFAWREEELVADKIVALWRGQLGHKPAEQAITGTVALVLKMLRYVKDQKEAQRMADAFWLTRRKNL